MLSWFFTMTQISDRSSKLLLKNVPLSCKGVDTDPIVCRPCVTGKFNLIFNK